LSTGAVYPARVRREPELKPRFVRFNVDDLNKVSREVGKAGNRKEAAWG
jgi:hypothetical protein